MKTFIFAAFVFVLPLAAADISGSWTLAGDIVGNALNMTCTFKQDGPKVTGTCGGPNGTSEAGGTVAENQVTFKHTVDNGQVYELTYYGTLDATGSSMRGEIAVAGVSGTFTATKAASTKSDFSGSWTFTGNVVGNAIDMKCAFKREGDKYTGTCTYQGLGDSPTVASIAGDKVTFENKVQREQLYDLTYNGTLDPTGTAMKGDIAVAGVAGEFSGTKDK